MANIIVIITASTRPITPTDKVSIDEAVVARIDMEALATGGGSYRGSSRGGFRNRAGY